jgi:uncharacterized protein (DUF1684 family)
LDLARITGQEDGAWREELLYHRNKKDEALKTSETSPMAGSQYLLSEPRETIYLTRKGKIFGFAYFPPVPDAVLMIVKEVDRWYWYDQGLNVICEQNNEQMPNGSPISAPARFLVEGYYVSVHPKGNRFAFTIFDPERLAMTSFEHLDYFPPDAAYVVDAKLIKFAEHEEVTLLTNQNAEEVYHRYGEIEFQLEGETRALTVFERPRPDAGSLKLFVPFKDATTGRESYWGGRVLEIKDLDKERFLLDFNRSYNPLCSYSPVYNCPIPPEENTLEVAIRAGEKTFK